MNVSDVLSLPSFAGARLVAGRSGLNREVATAMIVEAPDIASWGKEGQLLITSFYAFEHLDEEQLDLFFDQAESIGIGGIVFKPERLIAESPRALIDRCESHGIPLIQVAKETKYESLLLDVLGHFLDSNILVLNRFFELHRQTMALALKQPRMLEILLNLRGIIHADVTFFDSTKNRRITTSQELSDFRSPRLSELPANRYRTHHYFDAALKYPDLTRRATAVLIPSSDDQIYYLVLHIKSERLSPLDSMAIENVVSLLQMEVLKQNALDRKLFFQNNNLVRDLLTNDSLDRGRIDGILAALEIGQHDLFETLMLHIDLDDPSAVDRREDVLLMARRRLKMIYPEIAYFESNDSITFVHNFRNEASRFSSDTVEDIMEEVAAVPAMPSFTYLAALSSIGDRLAIPSLSREVSDIVKFFDGEQHSGLCLRYEDLGIYKLLMKAGDATELTNFVDPRVVHLRELGEDFFETAADLCDNSLNYQETARQLFVHPKTVRYRAERIQKLTGLDFKNPDDRLQISFGRRIFQFLDTQHESR